MPFATSFSRGKQESGEAKYKSIFEPSKPRQNKSDSEVAFQDYSLPAFMLLSTDPTFFQNCWDAIAEATIFSKHLTLFQ